MGRSAGARAWLVVLAATGWIVACSSSGDDQKTDSKPRDLIPSDGSGPSNGGSGGSGTTQGSPSPTGGSDGGGSVTPEQCIANCEAKFPAGAKKGQAIDQCWAQKCPACVNMPTGGTLQGPQRGTCTQEVSTPAAACSQCTVEKCCAVWDACFGDKECTSLNACANACYR